MGKGEIACYEQCLLFYSVFKRLVQQTHKNQGLFGKGLTNIRQRPFENKKVLVNSSYSFLQNFLHSIQRQNDHCSHFRLGFCNCFQIFDKSKNLTFGKEKITTEELTCSDFLSAIGKTDEPARLRVFFSSSCTC